MSTSSMSLATRDRRDVTRVLAAGAIVGLLDISYPILLWAVVLQRIPAIRVPQSIAAGLLGRAAFEGGLATAALGLVLHFTIAYTWTTLYFLASRAWPWLRRRVETTRGAVQAGVAFGLLVWLVMDLVVLPLSRATPTPVWSLPFALQLIWHPVGVGLPIALITRESRARS